MAKNYYAILGVLPTATLEEIKSAYRSRAKELHPDHSGVDSVPFLRIKEAYDVLCDPEHRNSYDRSIKKPHSGVGVASRPAPEVIRPRGSVEPLRDPERADLGTITPLTSFFSGIPSIGGIFDDLWSAFDLRSQPKAERHRTLTMEVLLTREEARRGGRVKVLIPVPVACPACGGLGDSVFYSCQACGGSGAVMGELPLHVEYPPGIRDRYRVTAVQITAETASWDRLNR